MTLLKAPPKQPKTTVAQLRLDEEARSTLTKYAEYLESSPSHVVTEAPETRPSQRQRLPNLALRPTHQNF